MEELNPEEAPIEVVDPVEPVETVAPEGQTPPTSSTWVRAALDIVETLLLAVILFFVINAVSARVRVDGFSMLPTLENGEFVLVNKLAYRLGEPHYGDIVVFSYPLDPGEDLIKRVIGLPGDIIKVDNGTLYINEQPIDEPYIAAAPEYTGQWLVPPDSLFVLGDNRNDSSDSHAWGVLPQSNVIGRAVVIYWPPENWEILDTLVVSAAP